MIPYKLGFGAVSNSSNFLDRMDAVIDFFFLTDIGTYLLNFCFIIINIVANFNTGFYKEGTLVMDRRDIVMSYLKTWFVPDLVSSFPYMWLMGSNYEFD